MTQATKDPKDEGARERAQKELTASVGTPLVRPEKGQKRRLFWGTSEVVGIGLMTRRAEASRRQWAV